VAALIIRLATLWFAIGLGAVALAVFSRRLSGLTSQAIPTKPDSAAPFVSPERP
jgi:hypothetical protein